jgi:hypothetical protein
VSSDNGRGGGGSADDDLNARLREALKQVAVALKDTGRPFALGGGYALWARGGPEPVHDVDFVVAETHAAEIKEQLESRGLHVVQPPEDWLFKVYPDGDERVMVDVLFRTGGRPVEPDDLDGTEVLEVLSVEMPVQSVTDLVAQKLWVLDEHYCDFGSLLPVVRAVREQVDWTAVEERVRSNDFAVVFLELTRRLGIVER